MQLQSAYWLLEVCRNLQYILDLSLFIGLQDFLNDALALFTVLVRKVGEISELRECGPG